MKVIIIADLSSVEKDFTGESYIERLYKIFSTGFNDVVVQCPAEAIAEISKVVPRDKIMTEPLRKGTASAIGLAAAYVANDDPKERIVFIFANQNVKYQDRLLNTLNIAQEIYSHLNKVLLIGVAITYETKDYGYIKIGKVLQEMSGVLAFEMSSFERNPAQNEISEFTNSWRYLWDTGCMICSAENLLEIYKDTIPDMFTGLMTIKASIGTKFEKEIVNAVYSTFPAISMSKGVYEKMDPDKFAVIPVDLGISKILESEKDGK